jgi:hypothetical protein
LLYVPKAAAQGQRKTKKIDIARTIVRMGSLASLVV